MAATSGAESTQTMPNRPRKSADYHTHQKTLSVWLDPPLIKELRKLAVELDSTNQKLTTEALGLLFEKYGRKPVE